MNTLSFCKSKVILPITLCLSMLLFSCGTGTDGGNQVIPGIDGPTVVLDGDYMRIAFVFEQIETNGGITLPIAQYPNSTIEIGPALSGSGTLMAFSIYLGDVFDGKLTQLDPQKLPDGRPLPGVPSGALPAVAFTIEQWYNVSLYLSKDVWGVFIPVDINLSGIFTSSFKTDGKKIGVLSIVGKATDGSGQSGALLMLDLNTYLAKALKRRY